jgi:nucleotide-binding universal stress UspA family protein
VTPSLPDEVDALLVPLDGSDFSRAALPVADVLADRLDAAICLLSVVRKPGEVEPRRAELLRIEIPDRPVEREVLVGPDPAAAIHEALHERAGAMICMATHGRGRSAALVGSVATEIVARSRHPLILVCPYVEPEPPPDTVPDPEGVIVCVDENPDARALVAVGLRWGARLREPVTVVTVAEDAPEPPSGGPVRRAFGPDGDVDDHLDRLVEPFRAQGHRPRTLALYDAISVADGLYRHLLWHPAILLVTGTRGRTGLVRLAFGSVAASIVRHCPAPVLTVPVPLPAADATTAAGPRRATVAAGESEEAP